MVRTVGLALLAVAVCAVGATDAGAASAQRSPVSTLDLLRLKDIASLAVSPDGKRLAFVTRQALLERDAYDCELFVVELAAGEPPRKLGEVSARPSARSGFIAQPLRWSPDGEQILYISDFKGADQVWAWPVAGGPPQQLTSVTTDVLSFDVVPGRPELFFTTFELGGSVRERAAWAEQARTEGMVVTPPVWWGSYFGSRGVEHFVARKAGIRFVHWAHDFATASDRLLDAVELEEFRLGFPGVEWIDVYRFGEMGVLARPDRVTLYDFARSPDGARVAVHTKSRETGQRESILSVAGVAGQDRVEWYRATEGQFSSLAWHPDGRLYFFQQRHSPAGKVSGLYWIERPGQAPVAAYTTLGAIESIEFDREMKRAVFLESSAAQPAQIVSLDLATRRKRVVWDANLWIRERRLPAAQRLSWTSALGVMGHGLLLLPDSRSTRLPPLAVVTYRASGFLRGATGDEYPIYPLVAAGVAVLVLDMGEIHVARAGPAHGDDRLARARSQVATIEAAMQTVDRLGVVDPRRRALTGLSYGASTTWQALIHTDWFHAAIVSDAGADPFGSHMRGLWRGSGEGPESSFPIPIANESDEDLWRQVSVSANAGRIRAPLLVNDSDYEFAYGRQAATTMQGLGKPFELVVYPDAGHLINRPAQRFSIYNRNIDWLRFWLMDLEDPARQKAAQYTRWRLLKAQHEWNERLLAAGEDPATEFIAQRQAARRGAAVSVQSLAPLLRE